MRFWKWFLRLFGIELTGVTPAILVTDVNHISIHNFFVECLIGHNFQPLVVSGTPTKEELQKAWELLLDNYQHTAGERNYKIAFDLIQQIGQNKCKLSEVECCVQILWHEFRPDIVERLKKLGYRKYKLDPSNDESYRIELQKILSATKVIIVATNQLEKELSDIEKDPGKRFTIEDYNTILVDIAAFLKTQINPEATTVGMFLAIRRRMKEFNEANVRVNARS